jgi:hypothetical protein
MVSFGDVQSINRTDSLLFRVVASEVTPNHVRTTSMAVAVGVNWLFSFIISRITPNMLTKLGYGTFLIFGCMCIVMVVWVYVALPETAGVALEDMHFLFNEKVILRSVHDSPGGKLFIGKSWVASIETLRSGASQPGTNHDVDAEKAPSPSSDGKHSSV